MKLLLAAATEMEIAPLLRYLQENGKKDEQGVFYFNDNNISICIHGVGMMSTTYHLTKLLQKEKFDFAVQAGIGGSFNRDIPLAEMVMITEETMGDLGAENHFQFHDIFELGLAEKNCFPFSDGKLKTPLTSFHEKIALKKASGLTVNAVSGSLFTANFREQNFHCDIESMEGAAFHYVCLSENIPFIQLRSISNYVEPRDKRKWKMKEAVASLNNELIRLLEIF